MPAAAMTRQTHASTLMATKVLADPQAVTAVVENPSQTLSMPTAMEAQIRSQPMMYLPASRLRNIQGAATMTTMMETAETDAAAAPSRNSTLRAAAALRT